ncbi:MAG: outer membrane lipoprotein-sorting protein [bacterium]
MNSAFQHNTTALLVTAITLLAAPALAAQPTADELFLAAEDTVFPDSFRAEITLTTTEGDELISEMDLTLVYRHETGSYMEVTAPARSRGLRFLQIDDALWMYNPRAGGGRAIRLSPRASFQGSTFSNRDLSDPEFADDYTVEVEGSETIDHPDLGTVECWVLNATARNEQLAYARIRSWLSKDEEILLRSHYFAKSGLLFKTAELSDIREHAGAHRPTTIEMQSRQETDRVSRMSITSLETADDLPDRFFTQRHLTR